MTTEVNGLLKYVDENGNIYILYPVTQIENVDGLEEKLTVQRISATLLASGWSENGASGFVQSVTVEGLTNENVIKVYPTIPASLTDKLAMADETPKIRACTRDGIVLTFEAWEEKPILDIPIVAEVFL